MFCVFIELPYEKQLKRIDYNLVESFKNSIKEETLSNGFDFTSSQSFFICTIKKENSIAFFYSISRLLFNLKKIIAEYNSKIHEVKCIAKFFKTKKSDYADSFFELKKELIPPNNIFLFGDIEEKLKKYIDFKKISKNIFECLKFNFFDKVDNKSLSFPEKAIILHRNDSYFSSLYNFMILNPVAEDDIINKDDKEVFISMKKKFVFFKKHRFSKNIPQYFTDTFLIYAKIYFKYFFHIYPNTSLRVLVDSMDDEKNFAEAKKIYSLSDSLIIKKIEAEMPSIYSIPEDFLELIYVILLAGKYFFYDEIETFLLSLNKSINFFNDVYHWMFSVGIILIPNNIHSICYGLIEIIERRIGKNKQKLNYNIAKFLWEKYESGDLFANADSENVFKALKFDIEDKFLVSAIFHKFSDTEMSDLDLKKYKDYKFYEALKYYQTAIIEQENNNLLNAYNLAKKSLTLFQDSKFLLGEYRALSILAFFSLSENKKSDALTYFLYALGSAEKVNDSDFICEALFNISVTYFLDNNLKQCLTFLNKLEFFVSRFLEKKWEIPYLFIQGRVYLQIGNFEKAKNFFDLANEVAEIYFKNLIPLCQIWKARALVYLGQIKQAKEILYNFIDIHNDALLFLLESFSFTDNFKSEFKNLDFNLSNIYEDALEKRINENKNIKSGFAFVEDLIWSKIYYCPIGKKMLLAFYNYYQYKIHFVSSEKNKNISQYLSDLEELAMDALHYNDPFSCLYLFFCYELYAISQGESSPTTTAYLSKSFKALQKTILNIGENDIRDQYMNLNLWNRKLISIAKIHKLI